MNILVCFKVLADLDLLPTADFVADGQLQVDTAFVPTALNCYDESALEMVRALAQNAGEKPTLTALTLGGETADTTLKTLYALGYDHGVRIQTGDDTRFAPERVAAAIAAYVQTHPQDVIVTGVQTPEGDNGQTPLLLAERLGWPCVTQVSGLHCAEVGLLKVDSAVDGGRLCQTLRAPLVLAVGDAPNTYLQVPTLKDRMQKGRRPIEVLALDELAPLPSPAARLQALGPLQHARRGQVIEGETPSKKAKTLYESYLKEILEQL